MITDGFVLNQKPAPAGNSRKKIWLMVVLWGVLAWLCLPWIERFLPDKAVLKTIDFQGNRRHYFLYVPPNLESPKKYPALFFLQGFDSVNQPSESTRDAYRFICRQADRYKFIAVFPRGKQGAFPEAPDVLAWCPGQFRENRLFLETLCQKLEQDLPIDPDRVILGGFSNGAYFGAFELLTRVESPFSGFWLDAGGFPYAIDLRVKRKKVFISLGRRDEFNYDPIKQLVKFLREHGWESGKTLMVCEHAWAHILYEEAFPEMYQFLSGN